MTALQTKRDVPIVFTIAPDLVGAEFAPRRARNGHRRSADQRVESGGLVPYGAPADQRHSSRGRAKRSRVIFRSSSSPNSNSLSLKTAKDVGLTIPPAVLERADQLIDN